MTKGRDEAVPRKSTLSHFQKAIAWATVGVMVTVYTSFIDEGFGKLRFLQFAFFFASAKSLMKGLQDLGKAKPAAAPEPRQMAQPMHKPMPHPTPRPTTRPATRPAPPPIPQSPANAVESDGHRWTHAVRRNWYWVVLFLVIWQVFERI
jgi:hypothetical protein